MRSMPMSFSDDVRAAGEGLGRWEAPARRLALGIEALGLEVDPQRQSQLLKYLALLAQWSHAYNLTAITEPMAMVDRHLLDSLSVAPWLPKGLIVDVGTGAGLPGLVLAIAGFGDEFVLIDGNGKKVRFLRHVCRSLGLSQVTAYHGRMEEVVLDVVPSAIVARAVAPLGRLVAWTQHWLDQGAVLLAMKAELQESELAEVTGPYNVSVQPLKSLDPSLKRTVALVGLAESIQALEQRT